MDQLGQIIDGVDVVMQPFGPAGKTDWKRITDFYISNRVTHILNGQRAITGDTALRLGHYFGTSAELWLNPQKLYELRVAENEVGDDINGLPSLRDHAA